MMSKVRAGQVRLSRAACLVHPYETYQHDSFDNDLHIPGSLSARKHKTSYCVLLPIAACVMHHTTFCCGRS